MRKTKKLFAAFIVLLSISCTAVPLYAEDCTHKWSAWKEVYAATCDEEGEEYRSCSLCGDIEYNSIPKKTSHDWSAWEELYAATCDSEGEEYRSCAVCDEMEYRTIPKSTTHDWDSWETVRAATCVKKGKKTRTCWECGKTQTKTIAATGKHKYGSWKVTRKATISKKGKKKKTCKNCGAVKNASISKLKPYIKLKKKTVTLKAGKSLNLAKYVKYASGDKIKKWSVKNSSVASISKSGKVTAKNGGTTTVTVTLKSGRKGQIKVKVTKPASAAVTRTSTGSSSSSSSGSSSSGSSSTTSTVWLSATGSKYHRINNCGRMNPARARAVSLSDAQSQGYTACSKCF